jgi:adenine phosphoribosyltransferase
MTELKHNLMELIRTIPDFPTSGVEFRDITPLLGNPEAFREAIDTFAARYEKRGISCVIGIESRGFLFSAPLAYRLGVSLAPIRKFGKLPAATYEVEQYLPFGTERLQIHRDAFRSGARVVVIDDLLASGVTTAAACELVEMAGGVVEEVGCLIELPRLNGRAKLTRYPVFSLIQF